MSEFKTNVNILELLSSSSSISLASISSFMHARSALLLFALCWFPSRPPCPVTSYRGPWAARGAGHSSPRQALGLLVQRGEAAPCRAPIAQPLPLPRCRGAGGRLQPGSSPREEGCFCTLLRPDAAQTPVERQQRMQEERRCWTCFRRVSVTNHWLFIKP